jgi:hypothetical protein
VFFKSVFRQHRPRCAHNAGVDGIPQKFKQITIAVGAKSIIGACSVVFEVVPENTIVADNPVRIIQQSVPEQQYCYKPQQ